MIERKLILQLILAAILEDYSHIDNILLKEYDIINVLSVDDFDDDFSVSVLGAVRKVRKL